MLYYTGHPFFDIGLATVTALARKNDPRELTEDDFDKAASFIEKEYQREPLKSFLGVAFTTNAWFNQPSFSQRPEKRQEYAWKLLRSSRMESSTFNEEERCVFTGEPATRVAFSDALPPGRAFRQHIPLLTGEGIINFFPWGKVGLPVSGKAILCISAFPLGCAKSGGRLLAVHSDNNNITLDFATYKRKVKV